MTGKIISFPDRRSVEWRVFADAMVGRAMSRGLNHSEALEFVETLKPVVESFDFKYSLALTVSDPGAVESIEREVRDLVASFSKHIHKLLVDRLERELDLYLGRP